MRIFNINKNYNIVCYTQNTRYGFKHIAVLHKNGFEIARSKICYYNRTWERFEFESVLGEIIENNFEGQEKNKYLKQLGVL